MTLLADLARLLRLMDPMPTRVLMDAEAAHALLPTTPPDDVDSAGQAAAGGPLPGVPAAAGQARRPPPCELGGAEPVAAWAARAPSVLPPVSLGDEVELLVALFETVPAVRSAGRRLSLGRPGGEPVLEVEIRHLGPVLRLAGLAPVGARLEVRHGAGAGEVPVTGAGYFTVDVPAGPVRLAITDRSSGRTRTTGWL